MFCSLSTCALAILVCYAQFILMWTKSILQFILLELIMILQFNHMLYHSWILVMHSLHSCCSSYFVVHSLYVQGMRKFGCLTHVCFRSSLRVVACFSSESLINVCLFQGSTFLGNELCRWDNLVTIHSC